MPTEFVLKASCDATSGIVAAVTSYLAQNDCYISEMHQFDDEENQLFFMRAVCRIENDENTIESIRAGFDEKVSHFNMKWDILDKSEPVRVLLMVSKFDHCLDDLLYRHRKGE